MTHATVLEIGSSMLNDEQAELLLQAATAVGRKFAHKYPALDAEDITTEVISVALKEWKYIAPKLAKAAEHDRTQYEVLHYLLGTWASVYCGREHYEYMMNTATVIYTPQDVRALLKEYYYNPDAWTTPSKDANYGVTVEARSIWANLADINAALERVSDKAHDIILAAYGPEDLDLPVPDKRRLSDAVTQLTRELNRHLNRPQDSHEGPGARRAMSNTDSLYLTRKQG